MDQVKVCKPHLGHSQPGLYPWSLYLEDSITRNYILQYRFSTMESI
jgi:hypothetical protein